MKINVEKVKDIAKKIGKTISIVWPIIKGVIAIWENKK